MNITEKELEREIEWAINAGWLPYYQRAAATYGAGVFDVADLMAITSRETNFNPKYLTVPGDGGHGYGPMQADNRDKENAAFIKSGAWKKADVAITMGARTLAATYNAVRLHEGQRLVVTDSGSGKDYVAAKAKRLTPNERYSVSLAAYNCGLWSLYQITRGRNIDRSTTGQDYSADVSQRAIHVRTFLARHEAQNITR